VILGLWQNHTQHHGPTLGLGTTLGACQWAMVCVPHPRGGGGQPTQARQFGQHPTHQGKPQIHTLAIFAPLLLVQQGCAMVQGCKELDGVWAMAPTRRCRTTKTKDYYQKGHCLKVFNNITWIQYDNFWVTKRNGARTWMGQQGIVGTFDHSVVYMLIGC